VPCSYFGKPLCQLPILNSVGLMMDSATAALHHRMCCELRTYLEFSSGDVCTHAPSFIIGHWLISKRNYSVQFIPLFAFALLSRHEYSSCSHWFCSCIGVKGKVLRCSKLLVIRPALCRISRPMNFQSYLLAGCLEPN
jgi:hypothetical protein